MRLDCHLAQQHKPQSLATTVSNKMSQPEIPKQCKAGVVVNEGPDFKVEIQMVDVPEPSESLAINVPHRYDGMIG